MFRNDRRNGHIVLQTGLKHPCVNRKTSRTWVEIRIIWDINAIIYAIQAERLSHLARRECRAVLQRAIVAVLNVIGIAVARPPTDHAGGWRRAGAALPRAASINNRLNFCLRQRAVEDFYFVYQSKPERDRADIDRLPGPDRHWLGARRRNQGRIGRASEHAVHVQLQGSAVIRKRNMLKLIER
jgi:hypothetical protein